MRNPLRSSECSSGALWSASIPSPPAQNTLPMTAASCSAAFSSGASPSRRAATIPCSESGRCSSLAEPRSTVQLRELLRVQRIALGPVEQRALGRGRQHRTFEHARDEQRRLIGGEGSEADGRGVQLAAAPARPALEELGAGAANHEQRHVPQPVDELVHEVQDPSSPSADPQHEHEQTLLGECLEQPAPRREGLTAAVAAQAGLRLHPDQRARWDSSQRASPSSGIAASIAARRFAIASSSPSRVVDARLRLDHLRERPERDAVAVGAAPALAPGDQLGLRVGDPRQLVHEPALADPRHADQRHELGNALLARTLERVGENRQLSLTADQLRSGVMRDVDPESRPCGGRARTPRPAPTSLSPRPRAPPRSPQRRGWPAGSPRSPGSRSTGAAAGTGEGVDDVARRHAFAASPVVPQA